ncbi:MAG: hypothetical protein ACRERD_15140 [Candidatus Binatia bacterium]
MHGFSIRQDNDAQIFSARLGNGRPAADVAILLHDCCDRMVNDVLYPFIPDHRTVRALAQGMEVLRAFHLR